MAVVRDATIGTERLIAVFPLHVIDDEEVEQAVSVDVYPGCGDGPQRTVLRIAGAIETGLCCDIGESAVAIVVIERVLVEAGDEDVRMSIVVVVAHGHADVVASACE